MPREILLYSNIYDSSAERIINAISESGDDDIVVRINTNGGSPESGFGIVAKFKEHTGNKTVKIDGKAYSMGAFIACYADEVEALDVSEILIHRAAYPSWYEKEYMTDALWENLNRINASLRTAVESRIDVDKFEKLKGVTLDQVFSNDSRIDVFLSAKEAKSIGLVTKITKITPQKRTEINALLDRFSEHSAAALYIPEITPVQASINNQKTEKKTMTLEQLKADHPAVYAQIFKSGENAGIAAERERVGAWLVFHDIDASAVKAGIEGDKQPSPKDMAELALKAVSAASLNSLKGVAAEPVVTAEVTPPDPLAESREKLNKILFPGK